MVCSRFHRFSETHCSEGGEEAESFLADGKCEICAEVHAGRGNGFGEHWPLRYHRGESTPFVWPSVLTVQTRNG